MTFFILIWDYPINCITQLILGWDIFHTWITIHY